VELAAARHDTPEQCARVAAGLQRLVTAQLREVELCVKGSFDAAGRRAEPAQPTCTGVPAVAFTGIEQSSLQQRREVPHREHVVAQGTPAPAATGRRYTAALRGGTDHGRNGLDTMDELFEALTLIQTRRMEPMPVVLFGRDYWTRLIDWDLFVEEGTISQRERRTPAGVAVAGRAQQGPAGLVWTRGQGEAWRAPRTSRFGSGHSYHAD